MIFFHKNNYIFRKKFCFITLLFFLLFPLNVYHHENIYVTLTSWKGRINFIHKGLEILLNNTIKPKKIILNLAIEEFPGKELQLPKEIIYLLEKYRNFEVFWVKKNNNVFKKIIPTINRFKKGLIISVDDDILYPNDLIENMLKCYKKMGGRNPMSFGKKRSDWNINGITINSHYGAGSIIKYKFFNNKINEIYLNTTEERINKNIKCPDDTLYTYAALLNGYKYIRCKDYHIKLKLYINSTTFSQKNKKYCKIRKQYNIIIRNYIKNKYNITIEKLLKI
jgi:hypothetical protein